MKSLLQDLLTFALLGSAAVLVVGLAGGVHA